MNEERIIRLQIMLDDKELEAVESWRFKKRMPSRAAAVRELLRRGLAAEGFDTAPMGHKSAEFGVVRVPQDGHGGE
jgi:metal-responsive CopG/Arc/MetJ family transcriptional regulator